MGGFAIPEAFGLVSGGLEQEDAGTMTGEGGKHQSAVTIGTQAKMSSSFEADAPCLYDCLPVICVSAGHLVRFLYRLVRELVLCNLLYILVGLSPLCYNSSYIGGNL